MTVGDHVVRSCSRCRSISAAATMRPIFQGQRHMLDQILVNKNMIRPDAPVRASPATGEDPHTTGMVSGGTYPAPSQSAAWASPSTRTATLTTTRLP